MNKITNKKEGEYTCMGCWRDVPAYGCICEACYEKECNEMGIAYSEKWKEMQLNTQKKGEHD